MSYSLSVSGHIAGATHEEDLANADMAIADAREAIECLQDVSYAHINTAKGAIDLLAPEPAEAEAPTSTDDAASEPTTPGPS